MTDLVSSLIERNFRITQATSKQFHTFQLFLPLGLEIEDNGDLIMAFQMNIRAFAK